MMNIATIHYIAQPDFINVSLFLFFLNSAKYFLQECTWMGVLQTKKYITKVIANRKKTKTNEKKKDTSCTRKLPQTTKSLLLEKQTSVQHRAWIFVFDFFLSRCCYNQYID